MKELKDQLLSTQTALSLARGLYVPEKDLDAGSNAVLFAAKELEQFSAKLLRETRDLNSIIRSKTRAI